MMRRAIAGLMVVSAALPFSGVPSAFGARTGWEFLDNSTPVELSACDSTIRWDTVQNQEYAKILVEDDGTVVFRLVTGALKVRVTNLGNGLSTVVNASGTGHDAKFLPNGDFLYRQSGPGLLGLDPDQAQSLGLPEMSRTIGNIVILFKADGSAELISRSGTTRDLCEIVG
jgi:hypothetical protein